MECNEVGAFELFPALNDFYLPGISDQTFWKNFQTRFMNLDQCGIPFQLDFSAKNF